MAALAWPQQKSPAMQKYDRDRAKDMLKVIDSEVRNHYYDTKFHGLDWNAKVAQAREQIDSADSLNMALSHIAAALDSLNDSHTYFLPPQHAYKFDYGWQYQMIGNKCYVTRVRPNSDAESKGVKPGDELVTLNGYTPTRENLWKMEYVYNVLRPQPGLELGLMDPSGAQRKVVVNSKFRQLKRVADLTGDDGGNDMWDLLREMENEDHAGRARSLEVGDQLMVLKIPEFDFSDSDVDRMIGRARKFPNLILDLRSNPGGSVDMLKRLVGGIFGKEVKVADRVGRKDSKPEVAKAGRNPFTGKLVVLVDSRSASASELFARLVQLEKRGTVMGDLTSGSVMEARHYSEKIGVDTVVFYGVSVTEFDLIMSDGKSLEHVGVTPDEVILPTGKDLAAGRDMVLARAAESLGVKMTPEDAGKAFPYEWPPQ